MKKYNCRICGAGVYTADTTLESVLCAECERDENMARMRSPEEIEAVIERLREFVEPDRDDYFFGQFVALQWVLGVER